jgi:hypothetical protein
MMKPLIQLIAKLTCFSIDGMPFKYYAIKKLQVMELHILNVGW